MSKQIDNKMTILCDTLELCEVPTHKGDRGFWLYDTTLGMNLAMRAKSEREAFVEGLLYYQSRLSEVEKELANISTKVGAFINQFIEEDENAY